jgi:hypothetical protein
MRNVFPLAVVISLSCGRVPVRTDLADSIADAALRGNSTIVDLGSLADFDWDEVCFLGAFMRPSDISAELGFRWKGKRSGARGSLVFVDVRTPRSDSAATGHLPIQRNSWFVQANGCIPRAQAKFAVEFSSGVPPTLIPVGGNPKSRPVTPFR